MQKPQILVILGPTSTGKTDLALKIARKINGEIISCDSRQVYRGLDIGTGKMPGMDVTLEKGRGFWRMDKINVFMYDVVDPKTRFDVKKYADLANTVLKQIQDKKKTPIIVGGTGLYLKALLQGLSNLDVPINQKLRRSLEKLSVFELQEKLKSISVKKFQSLNESDNKNPRRLLRAIEIALNKDSLKNSSKSRSLEADILKVGLYANRQILNQRIDERVEKRINQGMIKEAQLLLKKGLPLGRMRELGLEYGVLAEFLEGKISQQELIQILKLKIHQYAKRQMTYFKLDSEIVWFDIQEEDYLEKVEKLILDWYNKANVETS